MLRRKMLYFTVTVFLAFCACLGASTGAQRVDDSQTKHKRLAENNFAFACDLYKQLAKRGGNLFFSPHSVSNALAILLAGARGETAEEIAKALRVAESQKDFDGAFSALNKSLQAAGGKGKAELLVANAFWSQEGLALRPDFIETCGRNHGVAFKASDFAGNPDLACLSINEWVETNTKGKIKKVVGPGMVDTHTRFVLANVVYFKGKWSVPFPTPATKADQFLAAFKEPVRVPMMKQTLITGYHAGDGLQVVALPYADGRLSLCAVVAENERRFSEFESTLSPRVCHEILGRLTQHVVDVSMPRVRLEDGVLLNEPLSRMGITSAFSPLQADLSGIANPRHKLFVKHAIHKAYLDINEEGTEAAGVTVVSGITQISAPRPLERVTLQLDRPFVFLIRDNLTGAVLFFGRVMDPRDSQ